VLATPKEIYDMTIITVLFSLFVILVLALWFFLANGTHVKGKPAVARRAAPEQKSHRAPGIE
jgi:hypothetical protein